MKLHRHADCAWF